MNGGPIAPAKWARRWDPTASLGGAGLILLAFFFLLLLLLLLLSFDFLSVLEGALLPLSSGLGVSAYEMALLTQLRCKRSRIAEFVWGF